MQKIYKSLIYDDVYPQKRAPSENSRILSSIISVTKSTSSVQSRDETSGTTSSKLSTYDEFNAACGGDPDSLFETNKEKSKRICLNEELKYFRAAVQEFNLKYRLSTTSVIQFWQTHYVQLPLLSNLAKVHLVTCGSSVASESVFSSSAHIARKERSRLSAEILSYSVFLKDKLDKN